MPNGSSHASTMTSDRKQTRRRRTSVTILRPEIDVPDPNKRPSSSGRFIAAAPLGQESRTRPGPVGRWLVLTLIVAGIGAFVGYASLGHRGTVRAASPPSLPVPSAIAPSVDGAGDSDRR